MMIEEVLEWLLAIGISIVVFYVLNIILAMWIAR